MATGLYARFQGQCGIRVFDPLNEAHPLVGTTECPACGHIFEAGDRTTLVPLGPGIDGEAVIKALAGTAYNAVCVAVHASCAGHPEEEHLPDPVED